VEKKKAYGNEDNTLLSSLPTKTQQYLNFVSKNKQEQRQIHYLLPLLMIIIFSSAVTNTVIIKHQKRKQENYYLDL